MYRFVEERYLLAQKRKPSMFVSAEIAFPADADQVEGSGIFQFSTVQSDGMGVVGVFIGE